MTDTPTLTTPTSSENGVHGANHHKNHHKSSRLPGFYKKSLADRVKTVAQWAGLTAEEQDVLLGQGLTPSQAANMIENAIGTTQLPLGVACNFLINGQEILIPMAIEEPSVLAAVSASAKLIREGGGFTATTTDPVMIGQIQVLDIPDMDAAIAAVQANKTRLMELANQCSPSIVRRGGGARDIETRPFLETPVGPMLIIHLLYDTRDAMGANAINTAVETMAPLVAELTRGRTNLRILSNLTDRRLARAVCTIPRLSPGYQRHTRPTSRPANRRSQRLCRGRPVPGHHPQQRHHERH